MVNPRRDLEATKSVERLVDAGGQDVLVLAREHLGSPAALTQRVALHSASSGMLRDPVQDQVYLGLVDQTDPSHRAAVRLVLTTASEQHDQVGPTFQAIVNSVAPASAAEDETAEKR